MMSDGPSGRLMTLRPDRLRQEDNGRAGVPRVSVIRHCTVRWWFHDGRLMGGAPSVQPVRRGSRDQQTRRLNPKTVERPEEVMRKFGALLAARRLSMEEVLRMDDVTLRVLLSSFDVIERNRIRLELTRLRACREARPDALTCEELEAFSEELSAQTESLRQRVELARARETALRELLEVVNPKEPPRHFLCPLTKNVMEEPVVAADGFSYDREAIERWVALSPTSPLTDRRLPNSTFLVNHNLRRQIRHWREEGCLCTTRMPDPPSPRAGEPPPPPSAIVLVPRRAIMPRPGPRPGMPPPMPIAPPAMPLPPPVAPPRVRGDNGGTDVPPNAERIMEDLARVEAELQELGEMLANPVSGSSAAPTHARSGAGGSTEDTSDSRPRTSGGGSGGGLAAPVSRRSSNGGSHGVGPERARPSSASGAWP